MKTREQIIEDFFRARGFFHVDEHGEEYFYDPNNKSRLMPGHIYFFYPLDKHFDLFQKRVIEVMQAKGWYLTMATYSNGAWWWNTEGITEGTDTHQGETILLAAIEAATEVLDAER